MALNELSDTPITQDECLEVNPTSLPRRNFHSLGSVPQSRRTDLRGCFSFAVAWVRGPPCLFRGALPPPKRLQKGDEEEETTWPSRIPSTRVAIVSGVMTPRLTRGPLRAAERNLYVVGSYTRQPQGRDQPDRRRTRDKLQE